TPLHQAVRHGHTEMVRLLLEEGADKDATNVQGETPLYWAAREGRSNPIMFFLLTAGAKKEESDNAGRTPLHIAAFKGHAAVVRLLLEAGADADAKDNDGLTPL
ncbi:ankyrin repeat-containing domain protein, partial [Baffinella frigidus]